MKNIWVVIVLAVVAGWSSYLFVKYSKTKTILLTNEEKSSPSIFDAIEDENLKQLKNFRENQKRAIEANIKRQEELQQKRMESYSNQETP